MLAALWYLDYCCSRWHPQAFVFAAADRHLDLKLDVSNVQVNDEANVAWHWQQLQQPWPLHAVAVHGRPLQHATNVHDALSYETDDDQRHSCLHDLVRQVVTLRIPGIQVRWPLKVWWSTDLLAHLWVSWVLYRPAVRPH